MNTHIFPPSNELPFVRQGSMKDSRLLRKYIHQSVLAVNVQINNIRIRRSSFLRNHKLGRLASNASTHSNIWNFQSAINIPWAGWQWTSTWSCPFNACTYRTLVTTLEYNFETFSDVYKQLALIFPRTIFRYSRILTQLCWQWMVHYFFLSKFFVLILSKQYMFESKVKYCESGRRREFIIHHAFICRVNLRLKGMQKSIFCLLSFN